MVSAYSCDGPGFPDTAHLTCDTFDNPEIRVLKLLIENLSRRGIRPYGRRSEYQKDGIALYEADNRQLHVPKPKTPEQGGRDLVHSVKGTLVRVI